MNEKNDYGHHPSTYKAVRTHSVGIGWDDHATIHRRDDGHGVFDSLKGLYRGSLAEMVAMVSNMPEASRGNFVIQKAGDHLLDTAEIMALARRDDFPLRRAGK